MKVKEKSKYSIWQNVCFMVRTAWNTHKRVLVMCVVIAAVQVGLNLAQLYVTPEILAKVEEGASVKDLLLTIGMFSAALFLLMGAKGYLIENRLPAEVDVRSAVIRLITRKTCETSYPNTRDPKVLKMKEQADAATSSNRDATEHIWTTLTQILTNVTGFAMVGDHILVAPVVFQGMDHRMVYLPEGEWYDYWTKEKLVGPIRFIREAPLDTCPIYVKAGSILPTMETQSYVGEKENDTLILELYPGEAVYDHYLDNGEDFDYREGKYHQYRFTVDGDGVVTMALIHAGYEKPYKKILVKGIDGRVTELR